MDRVTQQSAALAEESAGASEELNAQAKQMKLTVDELGALIGTSDIQESAADSTRSPALEEEIMDIEAAAWQTDEDGEEMPRMGNEATLEQVTTQPTSDLNDF